MSPSSGAWSKFGSIDPSLLVFIDEDLDTKPIWRPLFAVRRASSIKPCAARLLHTMTFMALCSTIASPLPCSIEARSRRTFLL